MALGGGCSSERSPFDLRWSEAQKSFLNHASSAANSLRNSLQGESTVVLYSPGYGLFSPVNPSNLTVTKIRLLLRRPVFIAAVLGNEFRVMLSHQELFL